MKSIISKTLKYFRLDKIKNDRRIFVFTVCLLISTTLWFLDALSKNYFTTLTYNVKYVNPPRNLFLANNPPSKLDLRVQAHGFTLLRHKLAFSFSPLLLDLSAFVQNIDSVQSSVVVTGDNLIRRIGNQISNEISVSEVSPGSFILRFDSLATKHVKVEPVYTLNFKPQFNLSGIVTINPDSVEISGPTGLIDTIQVLSTVPMTFNDLETSIEQAVRVQNPSRTSIYPNRVILHVPVEKFTEKKINLPLQIINVPKDTEIKLFPSQVTLSFMVGLSNYENVSATDFSASVDFNQVSGERETLEVLIESKPLFIQLVKATPATVEYLIETE